MNIIRKDILDTPRLEYVITFLHQVLYCLFLLVFLGCFIYYKLNDKSYALESDHNQQNIRSLPTYTRTEVAERSEDRKTVWMTYKNGVYDMTNWVHAHPGGNKILMAAGKDLEEFFEIYQVHKGELTMKILEAHLIGNLDPNENVSTTTKPCDAGLPSQLKLEDYATPNSIISVSNHLPVPEVGGKNVVRIEGRGMKKPVVFSVEELKNTFDSYTVQAKLKYRLNRLSMKKFDEDGAEIDLNTNPRWTGVKLSDLLKHIGADKNEFKYVIFHGGAEDVAIVPYEASLSVETAYDPDEAVLLAWSMNGNDIPRDHGYPIRVIMPGAVNSKSVKWLRRIVLSEDKSHGFFKPKDYESFTSEVDWKSVDFKNKLPNQEKSIQTAIVTPVNGKDLDSNTSSISVEGFAWSSSEDVTHVDVSVDGGQSWTSAELTKSEGVAQKNLSWTSWKVDVPIPLKHQGQLHIICMAANHSNDTKARLPGDSWNLGNNANSTSHVNVNIHKT